ncbi:MAG: hypothetical protein A3C30_02615 [Candidatus Levybacteria bacterium RIFCSPHIGHO2_02_FULL_40_18]|nr:MAG: hypothetical protein A2869_05360 [Candidatus Levybacteria bacterium RIFCSPHIGHO2_01_FULL_40_58]OGH26868.1 MAG: hypothetical protein A3C30_02615 [Candidatus Levybacteria bacterium RIFCSPHIGHO2_02_FULL_40_18]OGH31990.1 MAG: hypothetical protein A3E43_03595 [Candidatus Levybacteria bacterium RIFCSPHIGHO2_12_FULL_40_31]OGH40888.1 MAG: hypothetical protein A2894_04805 [Candidatus Levybacteria bacterium RIFCSPLOWO2_01_FULL_40_64]OGH49541.1 MAG: hypothetical protein A3I54_00140 [Candidatus Lev
MNIVLVLAEIAIAVIGYFALRAKYVWLVKDQGIHPMYVIVGLVLMLSFTLMSMMISIGVETFTWTSAIILMPAPLMLALPLLLGKLERRINTGRAHRSKTE